MNPRHARRLGGVGLVALLAAGCEPPPVVPTQDRRQNQQASRIEGELVVQTHMRGNAIVFLYDVNFPPPPLGTGRPVNFTLIPREELFGKAEANTFGPFTAHYAFSSVPRGTYTVRGFIDSDTCATGSTPCHGSDFIPWYTVTNEPNLGDLGGAAVTISLTPTGIVTLPREVAIQPEDGGALAAVTDVNVTFSELSTPLLRDRPSFWVDSALSDSRFTQGMGMTLFLKPQTLHSDLVDTRPSVFTLRSDATGIYPRVVVRKLAEGKGPLVDENDLDRNGILDDEGIDYSGDGKPDRVFIPASLVLDDSVAEKLKVPDTTVTATTLRIKLQSIAALSDAAGSKIPPLMSVPAGHYSITLVQSTGQTWRLPNDFLAITPTSDTAAVEAGMTQAFSIEVK